MLLAMHLLDLLFAIRPLVLVPAWSFFLLGAAAAPDGPGLPWLRLALFTLAMIGVHLVNQIVDLESDRINDKGLFLQRGIFTPRQYAAAAVASLGLAVGAAVATGQAPMRLAAAVGLGLAYSVPPVRLAARAGLDLLANAAGYGLLAPWLGAGDSAPPAAFLASTTLAVAAVFVHTTLLDLEGDRRTAKQTIGVRLGPGRSRVLAVLLAALAAAAAFAGANRVLGLAAALLAVGSAAAALRAAGVSSRSVCVGATALYTLAAAAVWPLYAAVVLGLAVATRSYYARRFKLRYPAL
jgi:chlorophyll synthase